MWTTPKIQQRWHINKRDDGTYLVGLAGTILEQVINNKPELRTLMRALSLQGDEIENILEEMDRSNTTFLVVVVDVIN